MPSRQLLMHILRIDGFGHAMPSCMQHASPGLEVKWY